MIQFLKENKLVISVENNQLESVRNVLKEVSEVFVIEWQEEKASSKGGYVFKILCPSNSFANAYYTIGCKLMRRIKIKQHHEEVLQSKIQIKYSKK